MHLWSSKEKLMGEIKKIIHWRLKCTTDDKMEYVWSLDTATVCTVDVTHTIDPNSIVLIG